MPTPFTVLTWNVGNGLAKPDRLTAALRDSSADIIGLEELSEEQAAALEAGLADLYPWRVLFGRGIPGKGILSRFPIHDQKQLSFHPKRPDLHAQVEREGGLMHVIVVHPPPPAPQEINARARQMAEISKLVNLPDPVVLMGDMNMTHWQQAYHELLNAGLLDAFAEAGRGSSLTFPTRRGSLPLLPMIRLDYIFHSTELTALEAWVGADGGSDHLPLFARFC
ncbi:MAG: endonuclease/exonuclease/phosphatase family protein [Anaerolineae bacterium]|nr:endonuclease/exonuclease/phosphatase family protein [Anaerolineae bacterium]